MILSKEEAKVKIIKKGVSCLDTCVSSEKFLKTDRKRGRERTNPKDPTGRRTVLEKVFNYVN